VPSGIAVVDAKAVRGEVEVRSRWSKPPLLFIAGRDRRKYLDGLDRQLQAVRAIVDVAVHELVSVRGALCFADAVSSPAQRRCGLPRDEPRRSLHGYRRWREALIVRPIRCRSFRATVGSSLTSARAPSVE
jgi:hypothetical protein